MTTTESETHPYERMLHEVDQAQQAVQQAGDEWHAHDPNVITAGGVSPFIERSSGGRLIATKSEFAPDGSGREIRVKVARGVGSGSIRYFGPEAQIISEQKLDTLPAYEQVGALAREITQLAGVEEPARQINPDAVHPHIVEVKLTKHLTEADK